MLIPTVGRIVHYFAYGTPKGEYTPGEARAAMVTAVHFPEGVEEGGIIPDDAKWVTDLAVFNPSGLFFNQRVTQGDKPGQWNWPPKV